MGESVDVDGSGEHLIKVCGFSFSGDARGTPFQISLPPLFRFTHTAFVSAHKHAGLPLSQGYILWQETKLSCVL
jgi:hypothetical protein